MNKRPVDKSKKSNIKCEHCKNWESGLGICEVVKQHKNYWNRCKNFEWKHDTEEGAQ